MIKKLLPLMLLLMLSASGNAQGRIELSMEQAVGKALANNPLVYSAREQVAVEAAHKRRAWALPQPEISVLYEGVPDGSGYDAYGNRKLFFAQRFEFPVNYVYRIRRHGYLKEQSEQALGWTQQALAADVRSAYVDAVLAEKMLSLAREHLSLTADLLEKADVRYRLGEEGRREYLWAKMEHGRAENALTAAEDERTRAHERLRFLLAGKSGETDVGYLLTGELEMPALTVDPAELAELSEKVPGSHARLGMSRSAAAAARTGVSLSYSSFLPEFSAAWFDESHNTNDGFWGMQVGMTVPLWFLADQTAQVSAAKANLRIAEWNETLVRNDLQRELAAAVSAVGAAKMRAERFDGGILADAEEVFRLSELSYRAGETGYVDLLLAQKALIEVRAEYLDAVADYNKAVFRLELAAGRTLR